MGDALKAYVVQEPYEHTGGVVFAKIHAEARRKGSAEFGDGEWESVECRRAREFDQFAPGPVPPLELLARGWWFECWECGRKIHDDMAGDLIDEGLDPADYEPCAAGQAVYCSRQCRAAHCLSQRTRAESIDALIEMVEGFYPGAHVVGVHLYGDRPEKSEPRRGVRTSARFRFPGGKHSVELRWGESCVHVHPDDVSTFCHLYRKKDPTHAPD